MNETELTETLDRRGQLDVSRGPGVYALEVAIPDNGEQIARYWHRYHDHAPQKAFFARLAAAESCLYVGASGNVYGRLCDHVAGEVRKASFPRFGNSRTPTPRSPPSTTLPGHWRRPALAYGLTGNCYEVSKELPALYRTC